MGVKINKYIYLFEMESELFAYNCIKNILIKINKNTYSALEKILGLNVEELEKFYGKDDTSIELLKRTGILFCPEDDVEESMKELPLKTAFISFPTTHSCNLRCKYCFAEHGTNYKGVRRNLTKKMVKDVLEFVYFDFFKDFERIRLDFVSGGEPLLNFQTIKDTVEISNELYEKTKKTLEIFLCTNGTINSSEIWEYINMHNINLGISLDGSQSTHDAVRVYEDGSGSYSDAVKSIKHIIGSSGYSSHTKSIWGLCVITGKTKSLISSLLHNKKLGIKSMQMKLARLDKKNEFAITEESIDELLSMYKELTEYFVEAAKKHDYADLSMVLNENDYFGKLLYHILYGGRVKRCYAGDRKLSFDANGNIYPCDSFVGNEEFILGNIYEGIDENARKKFVEGTIWKREKCRNCWARYICAGDCFHNSYLVNKNIYEPDAMFCTINRRLVEYALYLYHVIKSNGDLEEVQKIVRIRRRFNT